MTGVKHDTIVAALQRWTDEDPQRLMFTWLADGETAAQPIIAGELLESARTVAAVLQELGATGQSVVLAMQPGPRFIVAFFGALLARVTAVPVATPRRSAEVERCEQIAERSGAPFILADAPLVESVAAEPTRSGVSWLSIESVLTSEARYRELNIRPEHLAFIQYTSGSTGRPRGVMVSHGNIIANSQAIRTIRGPSPIVGVNWIPPYHDMGLIGAVLHGVDTGDHSVLMSPHHFLQRPLRWLEAVARYRATLSAAPDFALRLCVERASDEDVARLDLTSWRLLICGAEPVRRSTWETFAEKFAPSGLSPDILAPCYGLAENTLLASGRRWDEKPKFITVDGPALERGEVLPPGEARVLASCGTPTPGQIIVIVDGEGRALPEDRVGEVLIQGPCVTQGYYADEPATQACFGQQLSDGRGPFMRTGDLGFIRGGELYIVGRTKDLIKIRGRNLYAHDVETAAGSSHDALRVEATAAFSVEQDHQEVLVVAAELKRSARQVERTEVERAVRDAVLRAHGVAPHAVILLPQLGLPRTSSGKIQRGECRRRFVTGVLK